MEINFYISATDLSREEMQDFPGTYDWDYEDGPFFEEVVEQVLTQRMREKLLYWTPLFNKVSVSSLSLGADLRGAALELASCTSNRNDDRSYAVSLNFGPKAISEFLLAHWDSRHQVAPCLDLVIDHELIHLADLQVINPQSDPQFSMDPLVQFFQWILKWRTEGLADLPGFLLEVRGIADPGQIRTLIRESFDRLASTDWNQAIQAGTTTSIFEDLAFTPYAIGPWIMSKLIRSKSSSMIHQPETVLLNPAAIRDWISTGLEIDGKEFRDLLLGLQDEVSYLLDGERTYRLVHQLRKASFLYQILGKDQKTSKKQALTSHYRQVAEQFIYTLNKRL